MSTLREKLVAECAAIAPTFKLSVENAYRVGPSQFWRAELAGAHHAGSVPLRSSPFREPDEESLLWSARDRLRELVGLPKLVGLAPESVEPAKAPPLPSAPADVVAYSPPSKRAVREAPKE